MKELSERIEQRGAIYLWKYKTDGWIGSEWHFSVDETGKIFFLSLLDEFEKCDTESRYSIQLTEVTQEVLEIPDFNSPFENRRELKLTFTPFDSHFNEWVVGDNENVIDIAFGRRILNDWRRLVLIEQEVIEDNGIGLNEDDTLFIWPKLTETPTDS